ncbi:hypothetical protein DSM106972_042060 [Dulcicalothrix desertica PCC 7102]|uniref:Glycosyltransferase RgtA/B/C/D-like domain-containing protein n=1 Tax=Dulcicalothrix desertica PCC 7102 TaxID=232991 RepID=A0A433VF07_9CYAN|nr:hypothetical protein [Dulcicalothrix desertica]RUT04637.1 hypothetical protein DSM106972_042060 [Dulcicalothrix desertica PCC 7102]TWH42643.1 hypothetical protein CAL7102_06317 [Dulcicalothrix desertica PCC 7102]
MIKNIKIPNSIVTYAVLSIAVLAAWFPALGGHPLFSEEFHYRNMLNNGFWSFCVEWLQFQGMWRLLSQAVNGVTTNHPAFTSYLAVFTHIITACLFFRVTEILFKRKGLALVLALTFGVFPWGFQTIVNVMGYTPMLATTIFWGNLLLLLKFANNKKQQPYIFAISFILTFVAQSLYEILVFAFMFSGAIICFDEGDKSFNLRKIINNLRRTYIALAPFLSGLAFLISYKLTYPESNRMYPPGFAIQAVFSIYFRQYTNYYIFQPWLSPVTRNLIFHSWGLSDVLLFGILLFALTLSLSILLKQRDFVKSKLLPVSKFLLPYILLLIFGASLLYVVSGGYQLESRKRYSLIPLLLLLVGWIWCKFFENRVKFTRKMLVLIMTCGVFGISTSWLVTGVYLYEINRQDALAEFIVTHKVKGDIELEFNPDIKAAWPTLYTTIGFDMYDNWVFNFAPESKLGLWTGRPLTDRAWFLHEGERLVNITQKPGAVKLRFNPDKFRWEFANT